MDIAALLIVPLSFFAFVLKSIAAFGPGVLIVPLGATLFGAKEIVIVIGFLDLISNAYLLKADKGPSHRGFWLPMAVAAVAGSVLGAVLLITVPVHHFNIVLGVAMVALGAWFLSGRRQRRDYRLQPGIPVGPDGSDVAYAAIAGCMGGFTGLTGPALAWHLGRRYTKEAFRTIMIPVLFASAFTRVVAYSAAGSVSAEALVLTALAIPGLWLGLMVGNRLFARVRRPGFPELSARSSRHRACVCWHESKIRRRNAAPFPD